MSFAKNDEKPYYEINFAANAIIQLRFLQAEISTRLERARAKVKFLNGAELIQDKVGISNIVRDTL